MIKNIIWLIVIIGIAVGVYFFFMKDEVNAPTEEMDSKLEEMNNEDYIGMTETEAEAEANENDVAFRVIERDGEMQPTTKDFKEGRINAIVEAGVVTDYSVETRKPTESEDTTNHDEIIGMTKAEAEAYALENNVDFRIGTVDGEGLPVTADYRPGRITAETEGGVVIDYTVE